MKLSFSEATRQIQERSVKSIELCSKNKITDSYFAVANSSKESIADNAVTAGLLNNFQKIMDDDAGQSFTKSSDFGPYVMELWPLITAWYPDFPLKNLISVQDMKKPLAYMFFSLLRTGSSKGTQMVGDVVETPLGMRKIRGNYPTGEIVGEQITKGQIDSSDGTILAYAPLNVATIPGYLSKTRVVIESGQSNEGTYKADSVKDGKIIFTKDGSPVTDSNLSLEVATGILSGAYVTGLASASDSTHVITVNYVWDLDYATTENIQKVKEEVELRPMEATPRALMLEWTLFSEYLKKSQFGQDIRTDNTKRILNLLYQYQVRYILDELYDQAEGNNGQVATINLSLSNAVSLEVQSANVTKELKVHSNNIEIASGRMEGNKIVCGANFKSYLESLPSTLFVPEKGNDSAFSGPRKIGDYGTFEVYYDPMRKPEEGFMTYRGKEWYDAAYYLGEYMPIVPTDAISLGVTVRSSFVSMEAYKFDKPTCVIKLKFTLS